MTQKKQPEYPLAQVLEVKKKRVADAEKVVKERKGELEREEEKLKEAEAERDKVLEHKKDKLTQLRKTLDEGTTSTEVRQMKQYLEVVMENLEKEEEKVKEQKGQVEQAEKNLEEARQLLKQRRLEVDKIETHKKEWTVEMKKELRREEGKVESEIGSTMYLSKKRQKR